MRSVLTRQSHVLKGSNKITHKHSDAVAYVKELAGKHHVKVFVGNQSKPIIYTAARDPAAAAVIVQRAFDARRDNLTRKREQRQQRCTQPTSLIAGDVVVRSWGYDQTNVDFYLVLAIRSKTATLVKLSVARTYTHSMQGTCLPLVTMHVGEQFKGLVRGNSVSLGHGNHASKWNTHVTHNMVDGPAMHWSSYA